MRDPNRLDEFYDTLKTIHKEIFPDLRFMQLIENFQKWANRDLYYCEDSELRKLLARYVDETTSRTTLIDINKLTISKGKHCKNSSNCYLGSCIYKNICGADINLTDEDPCPLEVENYEMFLEESIWNKTDESS